MIYWKVISKILLFLIVLLSYKTIYVINIIYLFNLYNL